MNKINLPAPETFHVKMKLFDINGEYAEKTVEVEDTIYDVTDSKKVKKFVKDGYRERKADKDGTTTDVLTRKVIKKVHAFPRNGINQPMIPLGGTRGYLTGALVAICKTIGNQQGQQLFGIHSWLQNGGLKIEPYWIPSSVKDVKIADFFVKEAKSKVYYEQIPETTVDFDVSVVPRDGFDAKLIKELMKRGEGIGISPKRRGRYEIVEFN